MDHLNKQQIVLVVLLASFVTAITTGIVTVSLTDKDDSDVGVVNTVNRVVERTIERVATGPATTTIIKTENRTIIVGIDEILSKTVEKVTPSIVRIYENSFNSNLFSGFGIIISKEGKIFTDKLVMNSAFPEAKYSAKFPDDKIYKIIVDRFDNSGNVIFKLDLKDDELSKLSYTPALFGNSNDLKLAQNAIIISGQENNVVYSGIIQSVLNDPNSKEKSISKFSVNLDEKKMNIGVPVINLNGEIIGYKSSIEGLDINYFKPINLVKDFIDNLEKKATTTNP